MSTEIITMWRCDLCDLTAKPNTEGWADAIYSHGCPEHAEHVAEHKAKVDSETRGRGSREKATWFMRCGCGWRPQHSWATWSYRPLVEAHHQHLRATRPGAAPATEEDKA